MLPSLALLPIGGDDPSGSRDRSRSPEQERPLTPRSFFDRLADEAQEVVHEWENHVPPRPTRLGAKKLRKRLFDAEISRALRADRDRRTDLTDALTEIMRWNVLNASTELLAKYDDTIPDDVVDEQIALLQPIESAFIKVTRETAQNLIAQLEARRTEPESPMRQNMSDDGGDSE